MLSTIQPRVTTAPLAPRRDPVPVQEQRVSWPEDDSYTFDFPSQAPASQPNIYSLPKEDAPKLQRPVLLVHGYNSGPGTWENMESWLVRGGKNIDGGVVKAGDTSALNHDATVFEAQFSRPYNSVCNNAAELRQMIDRISAATGSPEIDIVAHSMGGLDTRHYLDKGDEKVKKFVMIATPNHGSVLADIELTFRDLGVPIMPPIKDDEVRRALTDLSEVRKEGSKENNPLLADMNKNWERQRGRAEIITISGNGTPTLANRFLLTLRGDGVVSRGSSKMESTPNYNIWGVNHGGVKDHPDSLKLAADFLTGKVLPQEAEDQEPPDVPPDREFVPHHVQADSEQLNYEITVTNERSGDSK